MNLYLVSQHENRGYETYDAFVVQAENERDAKYTHPDEPHEVGSWDGIPDRMWDSWTNVENVSVELLGKAIGTDTEIILTSFNAG